MTDEQNNPFTTTIERLRRIRDGVSLHHRRDPKGEDWAQLQHVGDVQELDAILRDLRQTAHDATRLKLATPAPVGSMLAAEYANAKKALAVVTAERDALQVKVDIADEYRAKISATADKIGDNADKTLKLVQDMVQAVASNIADAPAPVESDVVKRLQADLAAAVKERDTYRNAMREIDLDRNKFRGHLKDAVTELDALRAKNMQLGSEVKSYETAHGTLVNASDKIKKERERWEAQVSALTAALDAVENKLQRLRDVFYEGRL